MNLDDRSPPLRTHCFAAILCLALLLAAGCDKEFERRVLPTEPGSVVVSLSFPGSDGTLPADGLSTMTLRGSVPLALADPDRAISFTATDGTLLGDAEEDRSLSVPLDAQGAATATLRSSRTPGPVTVTARLVEGGTALSGTTRIQVDFVGGDETALLAFTRAASSAPADGATPSQFSVRVSDRFAGDNRTVEFQTSAGSFSRDSAEPTQTVEVDAGTDLTANVLLYSPKVVGPAVVTASLEGFQAETRIDFRPAPAEEILVTLSKFTVAQDGTMEVTATLLRRIGTPTPETIVRFEALDSTGQPFGIFRNVQRSQADGTASAEFAPDGGGTPGSAVVLVTADGSGAEGRANFELTAPPPS